MIAGSARVFWQPAPDLEGITWTPTRDAQGWRSKCLLTRFMPSSSWPTTVLRPSAAAPLP